MSALTADRTVPASKIIEHGRHFVDFPVAASTIIYAGGFVGINAAGDLVRHAPEDLTSAQGTHRFVGIAQQHINSQSAAGDALCSVLTEGIFTHALSSAIKADVGKSVYVTDDQTIALTGACSIDVIGKIINLDSAGNVDVRLNPFGTGPGEITRVINDFNVLTTGSTVMLLHESENHNGAWMSDIATVVTTAIDTDAVDGIVTIAHTTGTETTLGLTLTYLDNTLALDLIVSGTLAKLFGVGTVTADNMIFIPADKAVMAVLTTVGSGTGTPVGVADIIAKIVLM